MRVRARSGQRGLSLIEVTIMLLVLMLLTSVLVPSIFDFVNDAQWVKVKEDCEAIVISLARLHKDVGAKLYTQTGGAANYPVSKLDIMYSDGNLPTLGATAVPVAAFPGGTTTNWLSSPAFDMNDLLNGIHFDTCENQLITNLANAVGPTSIYPNAAGPPVGLVWGQGWRGAYMSPPCGPDPWGYMYQVNTVWATTIFGNAFPGTIALHCNDVFCMSPGKNGIIETPFGMDFNVYPQGVRRMGDDWVTVLSPCDP